jgi:hypothetical protein
VDAWVSSGLIILAKELSRHETKSGMLQNFGDGRRCTELAGETISRTFATSKEMNGLYDRDGWTG